MSFFFWFLAGVACGVFASSVVAAASRELEREE